MKLWQKEGSNQEQLRHIVEQFTVGNDLDFDILLAPYDVAGTIAHTEMLCRCGLLSGEEKESIHRVLHAIKLEMDSGSFALRPGMEDVHSQIEWMLTEQLGATGKKIHSGRSRNDQVLVCIKLFLKDELKQINQLTVQLARRLLALSNEYKNDLLPGYTHMQLAMPSSFGLWFGAYAESLIDDLELVHAAYRITDRNPLGSAAGYGSSFPIDRELTTRLLGFGRMNYNVVYAQMTRGKTEKTVAVAIAAVASTLARLSADVCLYMNQQFGFISFPDELTTGSSIMPHKKNPDVFELIRAHCNRIQSVPNEMTLLLANLTSGYHRDMQLTKEVLFPHLLQLKKCLEMASFMLEHIRVQKDLLYGPQYAHLFSVECVNELVKKGVPFRDAYKQVAQEIENGTFEPNTDVMHTHAGSIGNLCNEELSALLDGLALPTD